MYYLFVAALCTASPHASEGPKAKLIRELPLKIRVMEVILGESTVEEIEKRFPKATFATYGDAAGAEKRVCLTPADKPEVVCEWLLATLANMSSHYFYEQRYFSQPTLAPAALAL